MNEKKPRILTFDDADVSSAGAELDHGWITVPAIQICENAGVVAVPFGGTLEKRYWGPIEVGMHWASPYPHYGVAIITGVRRAEVRQPEGTEGPGQMDSDCIGYSVSTLTVRAWPDPQVEMEVRDDFQLMVVKIADGPKCVVKRAK